MQNWLLSCSLVILQKSDDVVSRNCDDPLFVTVWKMSYTMRSRPSGSPDQILDRLSPHVDVLSSAATARLAEAHDSTPIHEGIGSDHVFAIRFSIVLERAGIVLPMVESRLVVYHQLRGPGSVVDGLFLSVRQKQKGLSHFIISGEEEVQHVAKLENFVRHLDWTGAHHRTRRPVEPEWIKRECRDFSGLLEITLAVGSMSKVTEIEQLLMRHLPHRPPTRSCTGQAWSARVYHNKDGETYPYYLTFRTIFPSPSTAHIKRISFHLVSDAEAELASWERYASEHESEDGVTVLWTKWYGQLLRQQIESIFTMDHKPVIS